MSFPKDEKPRVYPRMTREDLEEFEDERGRKHYRMPGGKAVCGRLKKKHNRKIPDEVCLAPSMASGPCRIHGGKAGSPIKHGRYSKATKAWASSFEQALRDEELLDAKRDLALMDVVNERLVERAEALDCPEWREELKETFVELRSAIRSKRGGDVGKKMQRLGELIDGGATADQVAKDLVAQVDKRANRACKLTELQLRREEKITVSQMAVVFRGFLDLLEQRLDPETYHGLIPDLRRVAVGGRVLDPVKGTLEA